MNLVLPNGLAPHGDRAARDPIPFTFEGRRLTARAGDSVAAALLADGVRVLGRSSKLHRPRGYRCGRGHCSACAMRVDGLPGVRTCVTAVRPGMNVEREHAWPSADADVLRAADALSPLLPPGLYYRRFRRSPRLFGVFERGLAGVAGQGRLPDAGAAARLTATSCERLDDVGVLVVGGGPAGLSAALAAAAEGAGVVLVDRDDVLGGRAADVGGDVYELATQVRDGRIEALTGADAIGWYDEGTVAVVRGNDLLLVRPAAVVLATGGYDRGLPFPGWDLPGVMLASGALRLVHRYAVSPGARAVVLTCDSFGYEAAERLRRAGVKVVRIADCRPPREIRDGEPAGAARAGIVSTAGVRAAKAHGTGRVSALSLRVGTQDAAATLRVRCDLVCISAGVRPADDLAYQALCSGSLVLSRAIPAVDSTHGAVGPGGTRLWLAGLAAGEHDPARCRTQGAEAGAAAARHA